MIDLHTHSSYSDGTDTPTELVTRARTAGVEVLALTDHDCTDGLAEAQAAAGTDGPTIIPGIELSCRHADQEVHLLCYFVDPADERLQQRLQELRESRLTRNEKILARLAELGMPIDAEQVREIAGGGAIGRPHIARALMEAGRVASIDEAFARFLANGRPAYVERPRVAIPEAIDLVGRAGGIASIAHPAGLSELPTLLESAREAGLVGLEVHYSRYGSTERAQLAGLAQRYDLVATGGSDYHGANKPDIALGQAGPPAGTIERLRERLPVGA